MPRLAAPRTIFFDWHGTLADTFEAMYRAVDDVLPLLDELGLGKRLLPPGHGRTPEQENLVARVRQARQLPPEVKAERRISRTEIFEILFGPDEDAEHLSHLTIQSMNYLLEDSALRLHHVSGPLFVEQAIPGPGINGVQVRWHYAQGTYDCWWEVDGAMVTACQEAAQPSISLVKTVGTTPGVCAATTSISVAAGTTVYYCYEVTNTGGVTLNLHDLSDDVLGSLVTGLNYALTPGSSVNTVAAGLSISAVINSTTTNTGTWTAYNTGGPFARKTGPTTNRLTGPYTFDPSRADGSKVGGTTGSHVMRSGAHPEIVGGAIWDEPRHPRLSRGQPESAGLSAC